MDVQYFIAELWNARWAVAMGTGMTLVISALAITLGSTLGLVVGLGLTYGHWTLRFLVRVYTDFIRGTPVFVLVLASYYILAVAGIQLTAFEAGVFALTVFCSSHVGEIVRGALQAIPAGQTEASMAVGLTFRQTFAYVLLPQALRQILPTWVNTATEMVKASTLLSVIGVVELLLATQQVISRTYMVIPFYLMAGAIYLVLNFTISQLGAALERRFAYLRY
jgi:polar amino acid transport system permease protein